RRDPYVRADECIFQLLQQIGVNRLTPGNGFFNARNQPFARLLDAAFQLFQQRGLMLDSAEESLNHTSFRCYQRSAGLRPAVPGLCAFSPIGARFHSSPGESALAFTNYWR